MTISLNTASPAKLVSSDATAHIQESNVEFGKLIDSADVPGDPAETTLEAPTALAGQPADPSLEALLSALKLALTPGAALLMPTPGKAGDSGKAAVTKDQTAEDDAQEDPAAALLAALLVPSQCAPAAAKDFVGQTRQAADDLLGKSGAGAAPAGLGDAVPAPVPLPPSVDLAALSGTAGIKPSDAAAPAAAQLDRLLDTARDAAWLDRLSQDIAASAGAGDKMRFRMIPPNLGALDVSVERRAAGMNVSMTTHTIDARNLIADSRQQMVDSLKAQGVPLVQLSLQTAGEEQAGHRPPTFFNPLIEAAPLSGTHLAARAVEPTMAERVGRFA